jgi:hypothetical protein
LISTGPQLKKAPTFLFGCCQRKIAFDGKRTTGGDDTQLYDVYIIKTGRPVNAISELYIIVQKMLG